MRGRPACQQGHGLLRTLIAGLLPRRVARTMR